jgi:diacylglycerol kinase family enzyme
MDQMKVTLIYNPGAGVDEQPSCEQILTIARGAGHDVSPLSLADERRAEELRRPVDLVAIAGGDGTVGQIAKRLLGLRIPIAVIPMGTANNIAKTLGLADLPLDHWIESWPSARRVKFDLGVAAGPWGSQCFIEGMGIGLFTGTMSRLDASGNVEIAHLDHAGKKIVSVLDMLCQRLKDYPAQKVELTLDGESIGGDYVLVEIMNTRFIGPNLFLASDADPGDGLFDIVFVPSAGRRKLSRYLSSWKNGKTRAADFLVRRAREITMEWSGFAVHIDDEVWPDKGVSFERASMTITVTVDHHAAEFLAPA